MCLAQGPQRSDAGEARTRGPRSRVKQSTTEPLRSLMLIFVHIFHIFQILNHKLYLILRTYAAISNAHLSRVWKRVKLSWPCLSTINGFGSTQLSDILMSYRCSDIFFTK